MGPPSEKPAAVRARTNIILSFWALIFLLGVPIWWWTTAIPRAALPIQDMLNWEQKRPAYPIEVRLQAVNLDCQGLRQTLSVTQRIIDEQNQFPAFQVKLQPVQFTTIQAENIPAQDDTTNCVQVDLNDRASAIDISLEEGSTFSFAWSRKTSMGRIIYLHNEFNDLPQRLAEVLVGILREEKAAVAYLYKTHGDSSVELQNYVQTLPRDILASVERNAARAFKPSPNYHLSFSLFTAGGTPSSWSAQATIDGYVRPLLYSVSASANFSVTTQVQMYSAMSPSIQPFAQQDREGFFLNQNELTAFINTAEWPLSPSIGSGPTINFILYVPPKNQIPLQIEGTDATSWLIPQWGGIVILNPPVVVKEDTNTMNVIPHLEEDLLRPAFQEFQSQLLSLLGVSSNVDIPLTLRLRSFQRLSGLALYLRTTSNLGALARLAQHLANIPIPHHVAELVEHASVSLDRFREQRDLLAAQTAFDASEKAFFDKSMVGQVYFPDEHKVAVYLPLLGPIGVPLIVSLLREFKAMVR